MWRIVAAVVLIVIATLVWRGFGHSNEQVTATPPVSLEEPKSEQLQPAETEPPNQAGPTKATEPERSEDNSLSTGTAVLLARLPVVTLEYRERHTPDTTIPLIQTIADLRASAESGDADAALELAGSLASCVGASRSAESLEQRINRLYETRMVENRTVPVDNVDPYAQRYRDTFRFCEGITHEDILDHYIYMRLSAENGSMEAKSRVTRYGAMPRDGIFEALERAWPDKESARIEMLNHEYEAALDGDIQAMRSYGYLAAYPPLGFDVVEAVAFELAALHVDRLDGYSPNVAMQRLEQLRLSTPYADMERAVDLATTLLNREQCCYRLQRQE